MLNIRKEESNPDSLFENYSAADEEKLAERWTANENLTYIGFLDQNKELVLQRKQWRKTRIFKKMSLLIPTRTPEQCRSHHQKMQKKYKTVPGIMTNLRSQLTPYMESFQKADQVTEAALNMFLPPEMMGSTQNPAENTPTDPFQDRYPEAFGKGHSGNFNDSDDSPFLFWNLRERDIDSFSGVIDLPPA